MGRCLFQPSWIVGQAMFASEATKGGGYEEVLEPILGVAMLVRRFRSTAPPLVGPRRRRLGTVVPGEKRPAVATCDARWSFHTPPGPRAYRLLVIRLGLLADPSPEAVACCIAQM
jgi:hypothetical protein